MERVADILKQHIKETWYSHAFNDKSMFVILKEKWFEIALKRDGTWDEMLEYGETEAKVEKGYLENISNNFV